MLANQLVGLITSAVAILMVQTAWIASLSTAQIEKVDGALRGVSSFVGAPEILADGVSEIFYALATSNSITGGLVAIFAMGVTIYMIVKGVAEGKRAKVGSSSNDNVPGKVRTSDKGNKGREVA